MTERELDKTSQASDQPKPGSELKRLASLVGEWTTEWLVKDDDGQPLILHGTDIYEWMPGGFFLIHHTYVLMGDYDYGVMQVIGPFDASSKTYATRSFDSKGVESTTQARVSDEGIWTFEGEKQRARLVPSEGGQRMTYYWEQSSDGANWEPWMEMQLTRAT
jgi:hypothetical protein